MASLVHIGLWLGVALMLLIGIVSVIRSFIVAHRLHLLATDVIVHDPETFHQVQVIACEGCHGKRHVDLYRYGSDAAVKTVYLCYLCVPRMERTIRSTYQAYLTSHPGQSPQQVYQRFTAGSRR